MDMRTASAESLVQTSGGGGGGKEQKDIVVGRGTILVLAFMCFYIRNQAATGVEQKWKCGHPIPGVAAGNVGGEPEPGACELRPGKSAGYEVACINAKTEPTCVDLTATCHWNPTGTTPALAEFTDDGGAGLELTATVNMAMTLQAPVYLAYLAVVLRDSAGDQECCLPALPSGLKSAMAKAGLCVALLFFYLICSSWSQLIEAVFGGGACGVCADPGGPNGEDVTNLLWWSKRFLGIQIFWFAVAFIASFLDYRADPDLTWSAALAQRHLVVARRPSGSPLSGAF
jgi:hypothetical protein